MCIFILILCQPDNGRNDNVLPVPVTHRASLTEEELNEQEEQEHESPSDVCNAVFKVTCGVSIGALHKKRFASGKKRKVIHYMHRLLIHKAVLVWQFSPVANANTSGLI